MHNWHILIVSLPTRHTTERMRVWRALKALGSGVLRDGVYLLPTRADTRAAFDRLASEVVAAGGQAQVLALDAKDAAQDGAFCALFDHSTDYVALKAEIDALRKKMQRGPLATLARACAQLQKSFTALVTIDYFPGAAREQVSALLDELTQQITAKLNPGEPRTAAGKVTHLDHSKFQNRTWATRKNMRVDRMASAWLIARFIDANAKFKWLADAKDCPKKALGFDYDDAAFTHIGQRVTFEVLVASFGLEVDVALMRIGAIVHYLDVGGVMPPEAAGLEAILNGVCASAKHDAALLAAATPIFDGLYVTFHQGGQSEPD